MTILRDTIGKSTLSEGLAVPKTLESWVDAPGRGQKRELTLLLDDQRATATLRRIANARGHVQIKYENKEGLPFRQWLASLFSPTEDGMGGEYIELHKVGDDTYRVSPFPLSKKSKDRLTVVEWIFHRTNERAFHSRDAVREIPAIVQSVQYRPSEGQAFYNRQLSRHFVSWEWQREQRAIPELPLKCDFIKNYVQVEVEFGNARTYYQDYIKFLLAFQQRTTKLGVLIVPTENFAHALCLVGKEKAKEKGRRSYSGMIHMEKVRRELPFLAFMLKMPLAIASIDVYSSKE
ncbi:MAG: BglII/BstYI family type II restriction endonuclease [Planctomycetota bacterium]